MAHHGLKIRLYFEVEIFSWNVYFWVGEQCPGDHSGIQMGQVHLEQGQGYANVTVERAQQIISYEWSIYAWLADGPFHCWRIQTGPGSKCIFQNRTQAISHPSTHACAPLWDKKQPNVVLKQFLDQPSGLVPRRSCIQLQLLPLIWK
jgi:hypothetical protein